MLDQINDVADQIGKAAHRRQPCFGSLLRDTTRCAPCLVVAECGSARREHHVAAVEAMVDVVGFVLTNPRPAFKNDLTPYEWVDEREAEILKRAQVEAMRREALYGVQKPVMPTAPAAPAAAPATPAATTSGSLLRPATVAPAAPVSSAVSARPAAVVAGTVVAVDVPTPATHPDLHRAAHGSAHSVPWPETFFLEGGTNRSKAKAKTRHEIDFTRAARRDPTLPLPNVLNFDVDGKPYDSGSGLPACVWYEIEKAKQAPAAVIATKIATRLGRMPNAALSQDVDDILRDLALFGLLGRVKVNGLLMFKML